MILMKDEDLFVWVCVIELVGIVGMVVGWGVIGLVFLGFIEVVIEVIFLSY